MEEKGNTGDASSPCNSQKTINFSGSIYGCFIIYIFQFSIWVLSLMNPLPNLFSDDDEIDYSVKPEFYDSELDDKDEVWIGKQRKGSSTDAVLSCPACFTTLCLECQRHETYLTQYRAIFVTNCQVDPDKVLQEQTKPTSSKRKRRSGNNETPAAQVETFKSVTCSVCSTEVGVIDADEVYHFFNVLPSEA